MPRLPHHRLPLDDETHIRCAFARLRQLPPVDWPRVVGAAVGLDLISEADGQRLLDQRTLPEVWMCPACHCFTQITCLWCGADACARCWRCAARSCKGEGK